jgi:hypothetical protein
MGRMTRLNSRASCERLSCHSCSAASSSSERVEDGGDTCTGDVDRGDEDPCDAVAAGRRCSDGNAVWKTDMLSAVSTLNGTTANATEGNYRKSHVIKHATI